ncbi:MAG: DUF2219 family protein [Vicinamibacterales bacterium]
MDDLIRRLTGLTTVVGAAIALVGACAPYASAQTPAEQPAPAWTGVTLLHDNDGLPNAGNTFRDDNYSAGIGIRLEGGLVRTARLDRPLAALDRLSGASRLRARGGRQAFAVQLVGAAYTPDDLRSTSPVRDDRPFASLAGVAVRHLSIAQDGTSTWSTELTVGALGLDAARQVQTWLHRTRRWMTGSTAPPDPKGWSNQISNGGEPTAAYRLIHERRLAGALSGPQRKYWQATSRIDGALGYQTNLGAGIGLRAGTFTSDFWETTSGLAVGHGTPRRAGSRWELFAFGAGRVRAVAYDAVFQGQFRHSVHTVRPRRLLGEWDGGIGIGVPVGAFRVSTIVGLAQGRTAEWRGANAHAATWGTVSIAVTRAGW